MVHYVRSFSLPLILSCEIRCPWFTFCLMGETSRFGRKVWESYSWAVIHSTNRTLEISSDSYHDHQCQPMYLEIDSWFKIQCILKQFLFKCSETLGDAAFFFLMLTKPILLTSILHLPFSFAYGALYAMFLSRHYISAALILLHSVLHSHN